MPLHIEELATEVTIIDGESFLSDQQKEVLVKLVLRRLAELARENGRKAKATEIRRQAASLDM
jgi:hypothetical protein